MEEDIRWERNPDGSMTMHIPDNLEAWANGKPVVAESLVIRKKWSLADAKRGDVLKAEKGNDWFYILFEGFESMKDFLGMDERPSIKCFLEMNSMGDTICNETLHPPFFEGYTFRLATEKETEDFFKAFTLKR